MKKFVKDFREQADYMLRATKSGYLGGLGTEVYCGNTSHRYAMLTFYDSYYETVPKATRRVAVELATGYNSDKGNYYLIDFAGDCVYQPDPGAEGDYMGHPIYPSIKRFIDDYGIEVEGEPYPEP